MTGKRNDSSGTPDASAIASAFAQNVGKVHRTPLQASRSLSDLCGRPVYLKGEHLQKTGSFKVRGALNVMLSLTAEERSRGVTTISAGNHAQAVAWAASATGVRARVVMPSTAPRAKVEASRGYGADVILRGDVFEAFEYALQLAREDGLTFVHPFDDPRIIVGQAGVGVEIIEDLPEVETVVVPIGGGGLAAGVCCAFEGLAREIEIVGVEPHGACAMHQSFRAKSPIRLDTVSTIADGLGAPMAGDRTFPILREHLRDIVLVSDDEIRRAMALVLERCKQLIEPAGAAGVAALIHHRLPSGTGPLVVILSGGNVDLSFVSQLKGSESGSSSPGANRV